MSEETDVPGTERESVSRRKGQRIGPSFTWTVPS